MGELLAEKVRRTIPADEIDVVIPIPDSSRPAAMQLAQALAIPTGKVSSKPLRRPHLHHAGPGGAAESRCARSSTPVARFKGKRVLLVDDSIVRGTTSREIVDRWRGRRRPQGLFRLGGAAGALPQCPGIDMPTRQSSSPPARRRNRQRDRRRRLGLPGYRRPSSGR